jgi:hypothetical protein
MNKELVKQALDQQLSYYEDNVYRHILNGESEDSEVVQYHRKKIRELKEAIGELN